MENIELLKKLQGLQTIETASEALNLSRQATLNLLSRLKKEGYVTTTGGGTQKRLYKITVRKQRKRDPGMFDILNKYSPMKLNPWYDHQVHGIYTPEDVLIDAIKTKSFRAILASLRLFNHITDWKKLYGLAKQNDCWQEIGALYDLAKKNFKVKRMPKQYAPARFKGKKYILRKYENNDFKDIGEKWNVGIPFRKGDLIKVET